MLVSSELLAKYKKSIGDCNTDEPLQDEYYTEFLNQAISDLITDDISETQLNSELGQSCIVLYAEALMNKTDIATNPTISLQRNKLSLLSKGDRVDIKEG